jgi:hypothetical protein
MPARGAGTALAILISPVRDPVEDRVAGLMLRKQLRAIGQSPVLRRRHHELNRRRLACEQRKYVAFAIAYGNHLGVSLRA